MTTYSINLLLVAASPRLSVSASPLGRALLVAALLVSAYALVRYWHSLRARPARVRHTLLALRAVTLVLTACALGGVSALYESESRARVMVRSMRGGVPAAEADAAAGADQQESATGQTIAALRARGFEVVEAGDEGGARAAEESGSFVAGVLLTDGAMSATGAGGAVERTSVDAGGAPVFVVANDAAAAGPGVALEGVTVLGRAARGVPLAVRCTIHARGMRGRESLVTISDDAKVQASARIVWAGDDERRSLTLAVVPKSAGWLDYSAKVEAAGGEASALLARPFSVYVEERRLRVLFFEGEPTWEAKFIRRALEGSGLFEVDYFAQVSRTATAGASAEAEAERAGEAGQSEGEAGATKKKGAAGQTPEARLREALGGAARLNAYDCVIVGATPDKLLSATESARLGEWVERRGGGLVVIGGNGFNGSIAAPGGKLSALLPAEVGAQSAAAEGQDVARSAPVEALRAREGVSLTPTEDGAAGALGGYLAAGEGAAGGEGALTGQGLRPGALRPGATRLAVASRPGASGTSEEGATLVAAMRYGAGRTLLFAPADSWRIRTAGESDDGTRGRFDALWQGIVLWTAAGARPGAEVVLSEESPAATSDVTAEVRVRDAAYAPVRIERVSARLQPLAEDAGESSVTMAQPREIGFVPDRDDPSVWRARFPVHTAGRYVLEVEYAAGGRSAMLERRFAAVAPQAFEAGAALDTLRRTARASGGEVIDAGPAALAERLNALPSMTEKVTRTWELSTWTPLALLLPLLLSLEWFARRWWRED